MSRAPVDEQGPGGYVVVLFGSEAEGWCTLNKCPMEATWFPTREAAKRYMGGLPEHLEPHCLILQRRGQW